MSKITMRLIATALEDDPETLQVKALIRHPNNNGLGRNADGSPIGAHHLTEVSLRVNDEHVLTLFSGSGLAADPLFGWRVAGKAGDPVVVTWRDNKGDEGEGKTVAR